jgi:hypothetical protein
MFLHDACSTSPIVFATSCRSSTWTKVRQPADGAPGPWIATCSIENVEVELVGHDSVNADCERANWP